MVFALSALFVLLLTVIACAAYVARLAVLYIGADILKIGWRLLLQGGICIELWRRLSNPLHPCIICASF